MDVKYLSRYYELRDIDVICGPGFDSRRHYDHRHSLVNDELRNIDVKYKPPLYQFRHIYVTQFTNYVIWTLNTCQDMTNYVNNDVINEPGFD